MAVEGLWWDRRGPAENACYLNGLVVAVVWEEHDYEAGVRWREDWVARMCNSQVGYRFETMEKAEEWVMLQLMESELA